MSTQVRVWDAVVRITHWGVAAAVIADLANEAGASPWHRWIGYAALALVAVRLVWGFVGSSHARIAAMLRSVGRVPEYLARPNARRQAYAGHNPLGAAMAFALWALVIACGATGWMLQLDAFFGDETLQTLHAIFAWTLAAAAVLHVAGAIHASVRSRTNLPKAMLTGIKRIPSR